jgi:large subunit ribosomal protein L17
MLQFFTHERIRTTKAKAAAIRGEAEKIITIARNSANASEAGKVSARRRVVAKLGDYAVIKRVFEEIAPRFVNRNGGYTRIMKLGPRLGDSADMVILELIEE